MKDKHTYESIEEMENNRKIAKMELRRLYKKLGFIIFDVMEEIRLEGKKIRGRFKLSGA